ncbi:MAG: hypothetical protein E6G94_15115 [Alphaproteobacteria bacterium]|nr:MAG: hypothetical protein E6G94_15115 [Alphaproteobacteria bacterium]
MLRFAIAFLCGLSLAAPLAAQSDDQPIVVEGRSQKKRIDSFVSELTPAPATEQLGKFLDPICPAAIGLPGDQNKQVEARLRKVAAAVGAPVAPEKCTRNLYVIVGRDKNEVIEGLAREFPAMVGGVSKRLLRQLAAAPGPVAAWQVVDDVGTDGMPLGQARMGGDSTPVRTVNTIGSPSRLKSLIRRTFLGSIVVVEAKALNGVSTRQLADYAAMRTLAPTDTRRQVTLPAESILTLLDAGKAPGDAAPSVTWWDYAFLKSLYATSNDVAAAAQRDQMKRVVGKVLKDVPKEED